MGLRDYFGYSVALSGGTVVIGASANKNGSQGAAYVFAFSGGTWSQQQELTASDGAAGDSFGFSVVDEREHRGDRRPFQESLAGSCLRLCVQRRRWGQQQELTASDGAAGDSFGDSVSVSGATAVIAAYHKNDYQGAAYLFALNGGAWVKHKN